MTDEKRTILCVDDEEDVVNSLFDTFMDEYNVKTACSGKDALKIVEEEDIALVISDQRMPEMEGTELLAAVAEKKPICKKILLTGYADINAAIDAINLGSVDKYFNKPWDDDELSKAVEDLLGEYSMDLFFEKAIDDAKGMKEELEITRNTSGLYKNFLDTYFEGICMVGEDKKISYLNAKGVELLKGSDSAEYAAKEVTEVFLMNEVNKKIFLEKSMKKEFSPVKLDVKLADGSTAQMEAVAVFSQVEGDLQVSSVIFHK